MDSFLVSESGPLQGEVRISGAKNAVLAVMAAALLVPARSRISNVPDLKDVRTMSDVMRVLGAKVQFQDGVMEVDASQADHLEAPYELVKTMRASFYVLGPMLARHGRARVSLPGGCAWGPRPVDLHLKGLEALGAQIKITHGYVEAIAPQGKLVGCEFDFPISSVGATANVVMAAVLATGTTRLTNAAVEPEIDNLCDFLNSMGAKISGIGTRELVIEGVDFLRGGDIATIPDRIEAGTFLCAAGISRGVVKVTEVNPLHLKAVTKKLAESGIQMSQGENWVEADARSVELKPVEVTTLPYPGFPTDMQAQMMAYLASVPGRSVVTDTIYIDRFQHVSELQRLGADIHLTGNVAVVNGGNPFSAAPVMSADLRASAAMVLGGLVAEGSTEISRIYHLDRGYEAFEAKLEKIGGKIQRLKGQGGM